MNRLSTKQCFYFIIHPLASWKLHLTYFFQPVRLRISFCVSYILVCKNTRRLCFEALVSFQKMFLENHCQAFLGKCLLMIQLLSAPSGKSIFLVHWLCDATRASSTLDLDVTLMQGPWLQWQDLSLVDTEFFAKNK